MKLIASLLIASALCWGQGAAACKPSSLHIPGAEYPCVHPDNRATFRVVAPDAHKVQVRVAGQGFDMVKGGEGAWTVGATQAASARRALETRATAAMAIAGARRRGSAATANLDPVGGGP